MTERAPSHARASQEGELEPLRTLLHRGPITRDALALAYAEAHGTDPETADRLARKDIEEARRTTGWGALIVPNPYRLAMSEDELEPFLRTQLSRGLEIIRGYREQKRRGLDYLKALPLRQGEMFR